MSASLQINADLLEWAKDALRPWQHEAFRKILNNGRLTENDFQEILKRAQFDLELSAPLESLPDPSLTANDLPTISAQVNRVYLKTLKELENVNALKVGQQIDFGNQLTIIYGENGSGKSGYIRVLKKAARCTAKAVEPILPNVFVKHTELKPAKATFDTEYSGVLTSTLWQDGQPAPEVMRNFSIFDSKCAQAYISSENEMSFVPSLFDSMKLLSDATDNIKHRLAALAAKEAPPRNPDFLFMIEPHTRVGKALQTIHYFTGPKDEPHLIEKFPVDTLADSKNISALGQWKDSDTEILASKDVELRNLQTTNPKILREQLAREKRDLLVIQEALQQIASTLSDVNVADLKLHVTERKLHAQAYQAAVQLAFGDSRIEGVGSDAWKSLIETAAIFSTTLAYKDHPFPAPLQNSVCVLCQQPLDVEAFTRLNKFWLFLQEETATKRETAKQNVVNALTRMRVVPESLPTTLGTLAFEFSEKRPTLWNSVLAFFDVARKRLADIEKAAAENVWEGITPLDFEADSLCQQLLESLEQSLGEIKEDSQILASIKKLETEVAELRAQKRLSKNLQMVLDHISAFELSDKIKTAADSVVTNSITIKVRQLYTNHITDAFKRGVIDRLKLLGVHRAKVTLDDKPGKGKVLQSVALDGATLTASPNAVLSEGERTAISLAYFLADIGSAADTSGIIFDDPVTSLDHRIRSGVISALISEAQQRQVIVFTHDLVLFCELMSAAAIKQVETVPYHVESFSTIVGQLSKTEPRENLKVAQRYKELEELIQSASKADSTGNSVEYRVSVDRFYSLLRAAWERVVEEQLFNQVVSRYQKEVMTMRLVGVAVDKDAVAAVFQGMTRGSAMTEAHDHAPSPSSTMPTVNDLNAHIQELKDFVIAQTLKRKSAEKQNEHLKG